MNNTTTNTTANETISQSPALDLPDPRGILSSIESTVIDKLTDWGYDPTHALFLFVVLLLLAFVYNWLTSGATARLQGGNKYLLFIVIFIAILWFLEVI
jgi:hypothetical protein